MEEKKYSTLAHFIAFSKSSCAPTYWVISLSLSLKQNKHSNVDIILINLQDGNIRDHCQWMRATPHGTSKSCNCWDWLAFSLCVARREPWPIHTRPELFLVTSHELIYLHLIHKMVAIGVELLLELTCLWLGIQFNKSNYTSYYNIHFLDSDWLCLDKYSYRKNK